MILDLVNWKKKCFFEIKVLLYSPGWPETQYIDQAGLELLEIDLVSASQVLEFEACTTMPGSKGQY